MIPSASLVSPLTVLQYHYISDDNLLCHLWLEESGQFLWVEQGLPAGLRSPPFNISLPIKIKLKLNLKKLLTCTYRAITAAYASGWPREGGWYGVSPCACSRWAGGGSRESKPRASASAQTKAVERKYSSLSHLRLSASRSSAIIIIVNLVVGAIPTGKGDIC